MDDCGNIMSMHNVKVRTTLTITDDCTLYSLSFFFLLSAVEKSFSQFWELLFPLFCVCSVEMRLHGVLPGAPVNDPLTKIVPATYLIKRQPKSLICIFLFAFTSRWLKEMHFLHRMRLVNNMECLRIFAGFPVPDFTRAVILS